MRCLPEFFVRILAVTFGVFWFTLVRYRRGVILSNLVQAFPAKTYQERCRLGQAACVHLIRTLFEFHRIPRNVHSYIDQIVRIEGIDHYEAAKNRGKGVFVVSGHLGSFELGIAALACRLSSFSVIVKRFPNALDRHIARIRSNSGLETIPARGAIKPVLEALKNNRAVVFALDQNSTRRKGVFVDFFGKPACTMAGLAILALRTGAPVIGASVWRERTGSHVVRLHPEFPLDHQASRAETVRHMTQVYTRFIERAIRDHPEQWLWAHKRFKTRPPGERFHLV
jgi:KDO2-lipid IV(A) lauroyltransferase